jgi:hypothetical protein
MIDVHDLESLPIKRSVLYLAAGIRPNKIERRKMSGNYFLTTTESEKISNALSEFGISYNRSENKHFKIYAKNLRKKNLQK